MTAGYHEKKTMQFILKNKMPIAACRRFISQNALQRAYAQISIPPNTLQILSEDLMGNRNSEVIEQDSNWLCHPATTSVSNILLC
jgi:hypothetical protein